jgi:5-formyltetrahydrofolate cyclo-ligase
MLASVSSQKVPNALMPSSEAVTNWTIDSKRVLRTKLRALRQALPEQAAAVRSARIVERLVQHPQLQLARGVALFWPMLERREVDLRRLDEHLRRSGKRLYYPFMERSETGDITTGFRLVLDRNELRERGQRFAEPAPTVPTATRGEIDAVIVPALAATPNGYRLGYGSGFYDATLPDIVPPARSIVVIFDFQLMQELPIMPHDLACDEVVTDHPNA